MEILNSESGTNTCQENCNFSKSGVPENNNYIKSGMGAGRAEGGVGAGPAGGGVSHRGSL